ncbi:MAG: formate/nitrite transporter family protein [Lachnospiraceae bacterium]
MNYEDLQKFSNAAVNKVNLLNNAKSKYFWRSFVAGLFVAAATIMCYSIANIFYKTMPETGKFLSAFIFPAAVLLIIFIGGELFTGNNFVMAIGAYDKKVTWGALLRVWGASYLGNFVGSIALIAIFLLAGGNNLGDYIDTFIHTKLALSLHELLFRAILCNFFVCLAVVCGIKIKSEATKFLMIMICIAGFIIGGFEHSVANMSIFTLSYFLVPDISILAILRSMLVVTIGNIIGGGVLLAVPLFMMSDQKPNT